MSTSADRNLLFGVLALQLDFISREQLIAGMNAWVLAKERTLGEVLQEAKALSADNLALLEPLVAAHIRQHHNDPQQSLAALSSIGSVVEELAKLPSEPLQATLSHVALSRPAEQRAERSVGIHSPSQGERFRILRLHAQGGLGKVSVAQDSELNREVALKEIRHEYADDLDARSRFTLEAEITGGLEHPGIVPVYGLGAYADGRPFYAMRFIKGDSLKEACELYHSTKFASDSARNVAFRNLLKRFVDVCNAIAYAHSRGVLHRDLKPGNIMLGKYGETLVVDWGLAKALGSREAEYPSIGNEQTLRPGSGSGSIETVAGEAIGTPAFMSPEQAAGKLEELGPASDIYSLGATLYALLTGRMAFKGKLEEVLQSIQAGNFPPPQKVCPEVPVALNAVVLKAMALRREDRYATATLLAAEIEQYLADEPVQAYPEPASVRAKRWARKHPGWVASLAATLLVGTIGLGSGLYFVNAEKDRTEAQRLVAVDFGRKANDAKVQAQQANELTQKRLAQIEKGNELITSIFTELTPYEVKDSDEPLEAILAKRLVLAAEQLKGESVGDPLAVAKLQLQLGESLVSLGYPVPAIDLFQEARATFTKHVGADHPDTLKSMASLSAGYQHAGSWDAALPLLEDTLRRRRIKLGPEHADTLQSMDDLAECFTRLGKFDLALPLFQETIELAKVTLGPDHRRTLRPMAGLVVAYREAGKLNLDLPLSEEILRLTEAKYGEDNLETIDSMLNLANAYSRSQKLDLALPLAEKSLKLRKAKLGADHPSTITNMIDLAVIYANLGKGDLAVPLTEEALKLIKAKRGLDHPYTLITMNNLAFLYTSTNRLDLAISLYQETLELQKAKLGADHPQTLTTMANLGAVYLQTGKLDLAVKLLKETIQQRKNKIGADHPETLISMHHLGSTYHQMKKLDLAVELLEETLNLQKAKLGLDHPQTLETIKVLLTCYRANQRRELAIPVQEELLLATKAKLGADHADTLLRMNELAIEYLQAKQVEQALSLFTERIAILRKQAKPNEEGFERQLNEVAERLIAADQFAAAEPYLREALALRLPGQTNLEPQIKIMHAALLLRQQQLSPKAAQLFTKDEQQTLWPIAFALGHRAIVGIRGKEGGVHPWPVADLTAENTKLVHLDFSDQSHGAFLPFEPHDFEFLRQQDQLTFLCMAHHDLPLETLAPVADVTSLKHLNLWNTKLTDDQAMPLKTLVNLTFLNLGSNQLTDAGLELLDNMQSLEELHLQMLRVEGDGLKHLTKLPKLTKLVLYGLNIDDTYVELFGQLKQLTYLDLKGTQVTPAGIERLKTLLPNCKLVHDPPKTTP